MTGYCAKGEHNSCPDTKWDSYDCDCRCHKRLHLWANGCICGRYFPTASKLVNHAARCPTYLARAARLRRP